MTLREQPRLATEDAVHKLKTRYRVTEPQR
jgi:hypothetical protein